MRLDKLIVSTGIASRTEVAQAVRRGDVLVNGTPASKRDLPVDEGKDTVIYCGTPIRYQKYVWVMLNKPEGYVSATEDGHYPPVTDLLTPELRKRGLFPVGRLDRDTVGLMLLSDDGDLAHLLLSPKRHVSKVYRFRLSLPLEPTAEEKCLRGIPLGDFTAKPALLEMDGDRLSGAITLTEGKYHEIKRMMHALGSEITYLERITFASLPLDPALARGEWRHLTDEEIKQLRLALPDGTAEKN